LFPHVISDNIHQLNDREGGKEDSHGTVDYEFHFGILRPYIKMEKVKIKFFLLQFPILICKNYLKENQTFI